METVYITEDGMSFSDISEAAKHEELLKEGATERLKNNLATHLSNKSKLKASYLRRDIKKLSEAWEEWQKSISACKGRFDFHDSGKCKAIYDALYHLESAAIMYHSHMEKLKASRKDAPRIHEILKNAGDSQISMDMIPAELLQEVKQVTWW